MTLSFSGRSVERSGRTILYPIRLDIEPGARIGLVGASGSGKSTLGHEIIDTLQAQGAQVAHVPQSPDEALDPLRRMEFHWREAEQALDKEHDSAQREKLFHALKIDGGDLRKRPWGWSRGMQQRFVIAMALIGSPDLLVMDEPTSALDPIVAAQTMELLEATLANQHTALLLITHDMGLAAKRMERLLVMDEGRIVEDQTTRDLLRSPQSVAAQSLCAHRSWIELPC